MIRSAVRKLLWMARVTSTVVGLAIMVALLLGVATAGLGATGGNFVLGKANSAGAVSKLTASIIGPALQLVNQSTASGATALGLNVTSGKPPSRSTPPRGRPPTSTPTSWMAWTRPGSPAPATRRTAAALASAASAAHPSPPPRPSRSASIPSCSPPRAGVQANGNANAGALMEVELRDAENTTTLASTGFSSQAFTANSTDVRELVSEGVLKSGISSPSPSEAPFVLQPGVDYLLRMTVSLNGQACTASSPFVWSSLSYIQLSKP